jgi:hypothetical protein
MFLSKVFISKYFGLKKYLKRILDKLDGMRNIATPNELGIYNSSFFCPGGGIGRRSRLKICRSQGCAGSIPVPGTN